MGAKTEKVRSGARLADRTGILSTSLTGLVDEFARRVFQELDYIQEGRNCGRFARLYGTRPDVLVPAIDWERTSSRVLTMEWVEGVKLSDTEELKRRGLELIHFVDIGIQCTLRQLLEHGFFHGDPHPGEREERVGEGWWMKAHSFLGGARLARPSLPLSRFLCPSPPQVIFSSPMGSSPSWISA